MLFNHLSDPYINVVVALVEIGEMMSMVLGPMGCGPWLQGGELGRTGLSYLDLNKSAMTDDSMF